MCLGNGKFENTTFNSRLQPTQIGLGSSATSQNLLKLNFDYGSTDNNGNVKSQQITVPTVGTNQGFVATQNYAYDSLNRLKSAVETIPNQTGWKQTFIFDRYGNRTFDTTSNNTTTLANGCPVNICNPAANPQDNKLVGTNYDAVGNTKIDANGQVFTYDAENKQTKVVNGQGVTIGEYFYDGDGKRIKKHVPTTNETTIFVYDASGKMVAEYSTIVANQAEAKVSYLTNDHLGSPRITTDSIGKVISRRDFMPFGEEIARANYGSDSIREKFATYERDDETGLDFAQARMYAFKLGRFLVSDMLGGNIAMPQTLNRYSYVTSNPLNLTDPTGYSPELYNEGGKRHDKYRLNPGNPFSQGNFTVEEDDPISMPKKVKSSVSSSLEEYGKFSINESDGTISNTFDSASVRLTSGMTDFLSVQGDYFFDRGVQEAALFEAAKTAIRGLIQNIANQGNDNLEFLTMAKSLNRALETAVLGVPIVDISSVGISVGPIGMESGRAGVDAVAAYNSYLAETDTEINYRSAKFSSKFANTNITGLGRNPNGKRGSRSLNLPLTEKTLQGLFKSRISIARGSGQRYLK